MKTTKKHEDVCDQGRFENGDCAECGIACEHWEIRGGYCLCCGTLLADDAPDLMDLAHAAAEERLFERR